MCYTKICSFKQLFEIQLFGNAVCLLAVLFYDFEGGKAACVL